MPLVKFLAPAEQLCLRKPLIKLWYHGPKFTNYEAPKVVISVLCRQVIG